MLLGTQIHATDYIYWIIIIGKLTDNPNRIQTLEKRAIRSYKNLQSVDLCGRWKR